MTKISISRLGFKSAIQLAEEIRNLPEDREYVLDFSEMSWVHPFGMLYVARAIRDLQIRYPDCELISENMDRAGAGSYAAYMGFFQACGIDHGNLPGDAHGSHTHLPLTYIDVRTITGKTPDYGWIEYTSRDLAKKLTQQDSGDVFDTLKYSFREIIRNVPEHSQSNRVGFCAQFWPKNHQVEVAIIDNGIGIRSSLKQNPNYVDIDSDEDAIRQVMLPGISSKRYQGIPDEKDNVWQNSGYGLYISSRLCDLGGDFFICSGGTGLLKSGGNDEIFDTNLQGTAIRLCLDTRKLYRLDTMLSDFVAEGRKKVRQLGLNIEASASTMSTTLLGQAIEVGDKVKHHKFNEGEVLELLTNNMGDFVKARFKSGRVKKVPIGHVKLIEKALDILDEIELQVEDEKGKINPTDQVTHPEFGSGRVMMVQLLGEKVILSIRFDSGKIENLYNDEVQLIDEED